MRNKISLGVLFIAFCFSIAAQNKVGSDVFVFLDPDFKGVKALYDKPNGKIIENLQHNLKEEDYIVFELLNKNDTMFYVSAYYAIKGFIARGWIKKDKLLGIYSKAYSKNPLILYSQPNKRSKKICSIKAGTSGMYTVIDCVEKWLKVRVIYKGKKYTGWMSPEMQCSDIYNCG